MKTVFHEEFYSFAKYYDIAFDFKDVPKECGFMSERFQNLNGKEPTSFIEFAAGPALHALEFARRGAKAAAVDLSPEMRAYGLEKAARENLSLTYDCADMVTYKSTQKFDIATILMDSMSYLITNDQVIQHLQSVAQVLNSGGVYILEMGHPRSVFDIAKSTVNDWEVEKDGINIKFKWGDESDVFNPITQVTETSVSMEYKDGERSGIITDKAPQRCFTATEWEALVRASGCFKIAEVFGAMDSKVPFTNDSRAWRMIVVLQLV